MRLTYFLFPFVNNVLLKDHRLTGAPLLKVKWLPYLVLIGPQIAWIQGLWDWHKHSMELLLTITHSICDLFCQGSTTLKMTFCIWSPMQTWIKRITPLSHGWNNSEFTLLVHQIPYYGILQWHLLWQLVTEPGYVWDSTPLIVTLTRTLIQIEKEFSAQICIVDRLQSIDKTMVWSRKLEIAFIMIEDMKL